MTVYTLSVSRNLRAYSMSKSDTVEIDLKTNNKEVLDYWNDIIMDLLSDEHYLDYLKEKELQE